MNKHSLALTVLVAALVAALAGAQEPAAETKEQRDARLGWWREAKFGLFVHWGLYAVPAGTWQGKQIPGIGEWIMNRGKIPVAAYAELARQFNPVKFDADEWVRIAKDAGMKYLVITAKHHDGFAMFASQASRFNIVDATPYQRDPLKALADACRKGGLKLGFYYSQAQDWHHPGGAAAGGQWDKAQAGSMDEYIKSVAVPQVKELLTNYGPLAVLWWDTPTNMHKDRATPLHDLLRLQPGIIQNNRLGGGYRGDTETPEQFIPATGYPGRDWETCMTMNDTWGFKSYDDRWKPTQVLLRNLIDIASKGGNYLLNVGPTAEGVIPQPSVERLAEVGRWMRANGEAIYGTSTSPFRRLSFDGRCTVRGNKLYLHVFTWPRDGKLALPTANKVTKAYLLTAPDRPLSVAADGVALPAAAPDAIASVVVVEVEGEPRPVATALRQATNGEIRLDAADAEVVGATAKLESTHGASNIGYWTDAQDYVRWTVAVTQPGRFEVVLTYACLDASAGSEFELTAGARKLAGKVSGTGGWDQPRTVKLGMLVIDQPGTLTCTLKPTRKPGLAVMNLRAVVLKPVG